ncbi:MAG TPA: biotin-dependent carboxyltransferase family protein, partial [Ramlibacter sp.]
EHLGIGVSVGGAMDAPALTMANWMVGNDEGAAGIEVGIFPFRIRFHRDTRFACTGAPTTVTLPQRSLPSWWTAQARAGDVLVVAAPAHGARAYLAFAGGIDVPPVLGSRATDLKTGFGGHQGRGLRKGDRLALGDAAAGHDSAAPPFGVLSESRVKFARELASGIATIRAIAAAEYEAFTREAGTAFVRNAYRLTPDCNRQGYRLEGAPLKTKRPLELLSHGLVPGTIQVPPSGQPIIQLAEANTCGGYPKIATVIEADLWRLAQLRPGQGIRFQLVGHEESVAALRELLDEQARIRQGVQARAARV